MVEESKQFFTEFQQSIAKMKKQTPSMLQGFSQLFTKTMADGAISLKEKEFIAVGIAVAQQCEPCIKLHVKKCLEAGATKEEVLDAACVAVMMGGGPAYTHMPVVIETLEALEA
ncbi:MAG: carboxymuconolactone decarboxylase family protein [Planctomycetota bacterium]